MYKLETDKNGKLILRGKYGTEPIHINHCDETLEELKKYIDNIYAVFEEFTNSPRMHLISAFSENEALEKIDTYLKENEGAEHTHLIGVKRCQF